MHIECCLESYTGEASPNANQNDEYSDFARVMSTLAYHPSVFDNFF